MTVILTTEQRANCPCYIGRTTEATKNYPDVGTVVCAAVDDGALKDIADTVLKWLREGLTVERVPVWWVRLHLETTEVYRPGDVAPVVEERVA